MVNLFYYFKANLKLQEFHQDIYLGDNSGEYNEHKFYFLIYLFFYLEKS